MNSFHSLTEQDRLARAFKALAHPNRLAIYLEVLQQQQPALKNCGLSQLMAKLGIGAPTLSHHTRELAEAGLIHIHREGRVIRCYADESMRQHLAVFFAPSPPTFQGETI